MKNKKLNLKELKVKSFTTSLEMNNEKMTIAGGRKKPVEETENCSADCYTNFPCTIGACELL